MRDSDTVAKVMAKRLKHTQNDPNEEHVTSIPAFALICQFMVSQPSAKAIADEWKPKLSNAVSGAANDNSFEAEAFLQLLDTFKIASEFDEEQLCNGRQVDFVRFHTFQLAERVSSSAPLEDVLERSAEKQGKGGISCGAAGSQIESNFRGRPLIMRTRRLEAVIRRVQDYGLEADYSLDPLQKRLAQLEKAKADSKKRGEIHVTSPAEEIRPTSGFSRISGTSRLAQLEKAKADSKKKRGDSCKHHPRKKSRPTSGFRGFRGPPGRQDPPVYNQRAAFTGMPESLEITKAAIVTEGTNTTSGIDLIMLKCGRNSPALFATMAAAASLFRS
ncbi:hypothetical protein F3Y22_tig00111372pilonHSYRG00067 [Hibiscus syriacus]|uniref:FRIGIDA-like protein n=1 Tax=Hibiscus syriacus TaxID=106335 RepID=A0A6A2YMU5_HIBSY|nr:hypothetical protein F3Y22_tig00111372pilonHSYRG00067 [Hibiscus syriacus]